MTERGPRGSSLIEAMVAITVIVTAVSSSLALIQSSITATRVGGQQVTAANLAREGLEVVRAMRDTNWLQGRSFQVGLVDPSGAKTARPLLDPNAGGWTLSFAAGADAVYVRPDGIHVQADTAPTGAAVSPYARTLSLRHICRDGASGNERLVGDASTCLASETLAGLAVSSTVRWRGLGGGQRNLTAEERLYDWR